MDTNANYHEGGSSRSIMRFFVSTAQVKLALVGDCATNVRSKNHVPNQISAPGHKAMRLAERGTVSTMHAGQVFSLGLSSCDGR